MARCITIKKNSSFGNERIILYLHPVQDGIYDKELDLSRSPLPTVCTDQNLKKSTRQKQDARLLFHILVGQRTFLHWVNYLCLVLIIIYFPMIIIIFLFRL